MQLCQEQWGDVWLSLSRCLPVPFLVVPTPSQVPAGDSSTFQERGLYLLPLPARIRSGNGPVQANPVSSIQIRRSQVKIVQSRLGKRLSG